MSLIFPFQGPSKKDKYLVLFPSTLLMLSVSNRLSAFIYEVVLSTSDSLSAEFTEIELLKGKTAVVRPEREQA